LRGQGKEKGGKKMRGNVEEEKAGIKGQGTKKV